ncbi:MAG TPA: efflux RND transporter periplasmic adaptor subunit [Polyangiales bacterium]
MDDKNGPVTATKRGKPLVLVVIAAAVVVVLGLGGLLVQRAESKVNKVALTDAPKPVTVIAARAASFRPSRSYVGTIEPWVEAKVGPQLVSAYVDTVLVRPGAVVKRGQVLATLDCRNASATSKAVSMQARAIEAQQAALSHEAGRVQGLLQGGFVSPNEAEQKNAQSAAQEAQLLATQAKLLGSTLEVNDCVLRAPFDGEIATRNVDPGAFARPDTEIVSVVDRSVVRITADVPEVDFDVAKPGTSVQIHVLSSGHDLVGTISRLAPAADPGTRTLRFEIDVPNSDRSIPVSTTAELHIDVGAPVPTSEIPLSAAAVRGDKASVFTAVDGVAHARTLHVQGERAGQLYLDLELAPGTLVVSEGRALLNDGDPISAAMDGAPPAPTRAATAKNPTASQGG